MRDLKTDELARLLGVTPRGLDELVRTEVLVPRGNVDGRGKSRRWSFSEAVALRIGFEWRRKGLGWGPILKLVNYIARQDVAKMRERPIVVLCGNRVSALPAGSAIPPCPSGHVLACNILPGLKAMERLVNAITHDTKPEKVTA